MSLMPNRGNDGKVAGDSSTYYAMASYAQRINFACVRQKQQGGFTHVGEYQAVFFQCHLAYSTD